MRPETRLYILWRYQISIMPEKTGSDYLNADSREVGALKYQMKLYFDKNKGLKSVFVSADVDSSQQAYKVDDGREALALYNEEVKVLDREYGPATIKKSSLQKKGNSIKVLPPALQNSRSGIIKIRSE